MERGVKREQSMNLPMNSLDEFWILQSTPRKLRESAAELCNTLSLHLKMALLRH